MTRPLSIEFCEKVEEEFPEMCQLMRELPEEGRAALAKTKSHEQSLPVGEYRAKYEYLRQVSFGISPLCRQKAREAQVAASARPAETQARLDEIMKDPAWTDSKHKDHRTLHREFFDLSTGRETLTDGNGEPDAD